MERREFLKTCGKGLLIGGLFPSEIFASGLGLDSVRSLKVQNGRNAFFRGYGLAVPYELGKTVSAHINEIFRRDYAKKISDDDFFHGHFLFDKESELYNNFDFKLNKEIVFIPEEYFPQVRAVIYHTREYLEDWAEGSKENIPRSIVGLLDSTIKIPELDSEGYRKYGTINGEEPFTIDGNVNKFVETSPKLDIGGHVYQSFPKFQIVPSWNGRFSLENRGKFDLYLVLFKKIS